MQIWKTRSALRPQGSREHELCTNSSTGQGWGTSHSHWAEEDGPCTQSLQICPTPAKPGCFAPKFLFCPTGGTAVDVSRGSSAALKPSSAADTLFLAQPVNNQGVSYPQEFPTHTKVDPTSRFSGGKSPDASCSFLLCCSADGTKWVCVISSRRKCAVPKRTWSSFSSES